MITKIDFERVHLNNENDADFGLELELEDSMMNSLEENAAPMKKIHLPPEILDFLPVIRRPFFPGMAAPIVIEPGPFYEILKEVSKTEHKFLGLLLTRAENVEDPYKLTFPDLYEVGVVAQILRVIPTENGGAQVILNMEQRVRVESPIPGARLRAKVSYFKDDVVLTDELKAYAISIITTIKELLKLNPLFKEELQVFLSHADFTEPGKLADFAVTLTTASRLELQNLLETYNLIERIDKALLLLNKELDLTSLQSNISKKIDAAVSKSQKEFFLREQLKTIKKELGLEKDDKTIDLEKFNSRLKERIVPPDVMKVIASEMEKFNVLDVHSAEYGVSRNYLDWLTILPWGMYSTETLDLSQAEEILEEDHYGLEDIKQRILEFISVAKLSGSVKGSIICLVGPPGVGKTSIGKSIARALNRKFYRFSVGGMRDEAEIKGHRRTYVGAMPGKLIQALKYSQTMNPVIMLDEVDKMGNSYHGDPASALLEVLDVEQNIEFLDHYLDVRCNLSDILFIVTANVLDTIPEPLKDRMDILRLSGYIVDEKVQIAKKYLIPRTLKSMGLTVTKAKISDEAVRATINGYAREAGVRSLENNIKKIMRKIATKVIREREAVIVEAPIEVIEASGKKSKSTKKAAEVAVAAAKPKKAKSTNYSVTGTNLSEYLGKPIFTSDRFHQRTPVGVCMGLAWTSMGGATLYIESIKVSAEKTEMKLTGQAGSVMKESSEIAWSYLHSNIHRYASGHTFFEKSQVHIHIPEGATPKDGPSAGITMVTSLISLLKDTPVLDNLGMTGELTLTGRILAIGGVKEKLIAARRSGLEVLIFPKQNVRDVDELPEYLKKGLIFHFVDHYDEVYPIAFPEREEKG